MKHKTWITVAALCAAAGVILVLAVLAVAGGQTDVVAAQAEASFDAVLQAAPALVGGDPANGWTLTSPDGGARFVWYGGAVSGKGMVAQLSFDAAPFAAAGLDTAKLPGAYALADGWLTIGSAPAQGATSAQAATALDAYRRLIAFTPSLLGYHAPMDHFGINLGGGDLLEWAQNLAINSTTGAAQDKDAVFVLNPEPLIAAGADPKAVAGWAYAQVPVMENGVTTQVYKFLKPFDLK